MGFIYFTCFNFVYQNRFSIFLGIVFLVDTFWNRKIKWSYILGGILGISIALALTGFIWRIDQQYNCCQEITI
jgi:hypothetical protein